MNTSMEMTPLPSHPPEGAGILHLGLGNFHRAHQAVYTAKALEHQNGPWGIVGVANQSHRIVDALKEQSGRYSVLTLDEEHPRGDVLAVHTDAFVAAEEPDRVTAFIADPAIKIITLTVTENGYYYSQVSQGLDRDAEAIQHDIAGGAPRTVIGQLARGLRARWQADAGPLAVVSCDNMNDNGNVLQAQVREMISAMDESGHAESHASADLLAWIKEHVAFPCTMVDRIVPATEERHSSMSRELTGLSDAAAVPAEPFTMWVLEDKFPAGRPAWEIAGAIFTEDVAAYELLKLRVLNSSNSLLSYLGLLLGKDLIAETLRSDPQVRTVVEHMMRTDMLPTFAAPAAIDVDKYVAELFDRFGNAAVGHRSRQVGSDGSSKLAVRITEPVLFHAERGRVPAGLALLAASYIRVFTNPASYPADITGRPEDPWSERLIEAGRLHQDPQDLVQAVLVDLGIFSERLAMAPQWLRLVAELLDTLETEGVASAIDAALARGRD